MSEGQKAKLIAMYFTQLHAIPENDEWWGEGFTDWVNVKRGAPLFEGHYQPRVPEDGYYDQSQLDVIRRQVEQAKRYGIFGFCHYHYWFNGKQLLETPTNLMLENPDIDFPFCLSWANETWSRRWDGMNHHILIKQEHPPLEEKWEEHFQYLIRAWSDPRAIKVDGKPVFVIYRPHYIDRVDEMLTYWRRRAVENGLEGVYFIVQKQHEYPNRECQQEFDAVFQFQPFHAVQPRQKIFGISKNTLRRLLNWLPDRARTSIHSLRQSSRPAHTIHDYDEVWEAVLEDAASGSPDQRIYPGAFVDWDNTARYGERATIFHGASPERFEYWLSRLVDSLESRDADDDFIFLNAWNEWAEGAYLEPDSEHGTAYLEAMQRAVMKDERD